jgi:hypothetical protein
VWHSTCQAWLFDANQAFADRKSGLLTLSVLRSRTARAQRHTTTLWKNYWTFSFTGVPVTRVFVNTGKTGNGISVGEKNANCSTSTAMATIASAPDICEKLISLGVKAFWNFSHYDMPQKNLPGVTVENVHLGDSLMALCYGITNSETEKTESPDQM